MSAAPNIPALPESRRLFGVRIHAATMSQVIDLCHQSIRQRRELLIGVVNCAKLVKIRHDAVLRDSVVSAQLLLADGMPVVWASRILRRRLPERVAGIDLFLELMKLADRERYRVYFLGATDEVLDDVVARVAREHPDLVIAGQQHGYYAKESEALVAQAIGDSKPDLLFVAMTSPKKERFLATYSSVMGVPICHGVGGSFDVYAGRVNRAPDWAQRYGLEWLYRVCQEPRRLWRRYLVTNTLFILMTIREMIRPRPLYANPSECGVR